MISLFVFTNTINDMVFFVYFSPNSLVLCKSFSIDQNAFYSRLLGNLCSLFHLLFSSFNASIIRYYFVQLLQQEISRIKYISVKLFNHLNNAFMSKFLNEHKKKHFYFFFSMRLLTTLCVILSVIYWLYRLIRAFYNILSYFNIRAFYAQALDIKPVRI
jgi:hypothetical protein